MSSPAARFRLGTSTSGGRVTPIELFFDLVFVFVVTQVTHAVETHPGWEGLLKGLLPMVVVWRMFSAFGWLTNAVRPDAVAVRILLGLAMTAFFIMGLDVPYAFTPEGWAFVFGALSRVASTSSSVSSYLTHSIWGSVRHVGQVRCGRAAPPG